MSEYRLCQANIAALGLYLAKQTAMCMPRSEAEARFAIFHPDDDASLQIAGGRLHLNDEFELFNRIWIGCHARVLFQFGKRLQVTAPPCRVRVSEFFKDLARRAFRPERFSIDDEVDGVDGAAVIHRRDQVGVWIRLNPPHLVRQALVDVEPIDAEVPMR